jgi:hypothetical protein
LGGRLDSMKIFGYDNNLMRGFKRIKSANIQFKVSGSIMPVRNLLKIQNGAR